MKIQSTALKTRKTVEMDHVRRRLSSSSNNVSNMRLDGAMGIPLQVQVSTCWACRPCLAYAAGITTKMK
jgi:hypothetical protein